MSTQTKRDIAEQAPQTEFIKLKSMLRGKKDLRKIVQDNLMLDNTLKQIEVCYRVLDPYLIWYHGDNEIFKAVATHNYTLWNMLSDLHHDLSLAKKMKQLTKGTRLYLIEVSFNSTYTGNHSNYKVFFYDENEKYYNPMTRVSFNVIGKDHKKYGIVYDCHGGNYSFSSSVVERISYFLFDIPDHFTKEVLHE